MKRTHSSYRMRFFAILLVAVLLLLGIVRPASAQSSISFGVGANTPVTAFSQDTKDEVLPFYWPVGFNAAVTAQIPLTDWMHLDPGLTYRIYPFRGVSQDYFLTTLDRLLSSSGGPMQELYLALGLRLQDRTGGKAVAPFLELSAGYGFERLAEITLLWQGEGETHWEAAYWHDWVYSVGVGLSARLSSRLSLEPSALWHGTERNRDYLVATVAVVYELPL